MADFPGYPVADDITNDTEVENIHPNHHNVLAAAVNDLQDQINGLPGGGGGGGDDGREIELQVASGFIQWRYVDSPPLSWTNLVDLTTLEGADGTDGAEVELRVDSGFIQWKLTTDGSWTNLLDLEVLTDVVAAGVPQTKDIHWESTADFGLLDLIPHTTDDGIDEWTLSTPSYGAADSSAGQGGTVKRARFTGPGPSTDGGNSRLFYLMKTTVLPPSIGGRVRQVFYNHSGTGTNNGQGGNVHAVSSIGGGQYRGIVVWHDIFVANPRVINFNVWTTETTGGAGDGSTSVTGGKNWDWSDVLNAGQNYSFLQSWKFGSTTYLRMADPLHGLTTSDTIHVYGNSHLITFGETAITSVAGEVIGFSSIATRNSMNGGGGTVQRGGTQAPFPYVLESFLTDDGEAVHARVYPLRQGIAPPDWGDERFATRWDIPSGYEVTTPGQHGICVNHLGGLGKFHEIATLTVESRP